MPGYKCYSRLEERVNGRAPMATSLHASQLFLAWAQELPAICSRVFPVLWYTTVSAGAWAQGKPATLFANVFCSWDA